MLWRLALFYVAVAPLELYLGDYVEGGPPNIGPRVGLETAAGLVLALLLGPVFNTIVSLVLIKRAGRVSGFTAGVMNALGFNLMTLVLGSLHDITTELALELNLVKLFVPWLLSSIPWIRRNVLSLRRPKSIPALFGSSATELPEGADVARTLALTDPFERGLRALRVRRPAAWDESPARLAAPPRRVPASLACALVTGGGSARGWAALSLGLLAAGLACRLERTRAIPFERRGVRETAHLLDCRTSSAPGGLRSGTRYRYEVGGVAYEGVSSYDLPCRVFSEDGQDPVETDAAAILYLPRHPERSLPLESPYDQPLAWMLLLLLAAALGIHGGLARIIEALSGVSALRNGRLLFGETLAGFPAALAVGPKRYVPTLTSSPTRGRLVVEVLEPRVRGAAGPALLLPDGGPIVAWDHLPVVPGVNEKGQLVGPSSWTTLLGRTLLPALAALLAILAVAGWLRLLA